MTTTAEITRIQRVIGENLERIQTMKEIPNNTICDGLGITQADLRAYKAGARGMATSRLVILAKVMGVSPNDLLNNTY